MYLASATPIFNNMSKKKQSRLAAFESLSAVLTGFSLADIQGTGLAATYLKKVDEFVQGDQLNELFGSFLQLKIDPSAELDLRQKMAVAELMEHDRFGSMMRTIIEIWYTGQMPAPDGSIISSRAYIEGLVWRAIAAHPMGAKQPGFGTWAFPPDTFTY